MSTLRPDVDPALVATIERAMARDPRWRFATAEQMRASLDAPAQPPRRTGAVLAAGAILLVLVLAGLLVAV